MLNRDGMQKDAHVRQLYAPPSHISTALEPGHPLLGRENLRSVVTKQVRDGRLQLVEVIRWDGPKQSVEGA